MTLQPIHKALSFVLLLCFFLFILSTHFLFAITATAEATVENNNRSPNSLPSFELVITEVSPFEASNLEWIEIYNPSSETINIQDLKLIENETNHSLSSSGSNTFELAPKDFAIIANKADQLIEILELSDSENQKIYDSSWSSLNLSGEPLQLSLNDIILDSINYGESTQNTSLERNQSFSNEDTIEFTHHSDSNTFLAPNSNWIPLENPIDCQEFPEDETCQSSPIYCELYPENPPEDCQTLCPLPPDPITLTEYLESPVLLISEVSFKDSTQDWIEIYLDPKDTPLDLSQYYLQIDNTQIPLGNETLDEPKLFKFEQTLVGTSEQITLRNDEQIFDTICWQNSNPSASEILDLSLILEQEAWHNECLNSELLNNNQSLSRQNFFTNTKSSQDWITSYHSTPLEFNYEENQAPLAKIEIQSGQTSAEEKIKLNLDGSQSSDPDLDKLEYKWTLDDVEFSDKANPPSLDINEIGAHQITLFVIDPYETSGTATLYLEILEKSLPSTNTNTSTISNNDSTSSIASLNPKSTEETNSETINFNFTDGKLVIHSFLANPKGSDTNQEWIKIQNLDDKPLSLENWILDDELEGGSKAYRIPKIELAPQEIYSFSNSETKISLKNTADIIHLLKPDKSIKDQLSYTDLKEDEIIFKDTVSNTLIREKSLISNSNTSSKSSTKKNATNSKTSQKSSKKNDKTYPNGDLNPSIQLTEIFANPKGPDKNKEWIELYNPNDKETNLSNWKLFNNTKEFLIHDTIIPPKTYLKIPLNDFSLTNTSTQILLKDFQDQTISESSYDKAIEDQSYQILNEKWYWLKTLTPGQANPNLLKIEGIINSIDTENQILNILDSSEKLFKITYSDRELLEQFAPDSQYSLKLEVLELKDHLELFKILSLNKIIETQPKSLPLIPLGITSLGLIPAFVYKQQLYKLGLTTFQKLIS